MKNIIFSNINKKIINHRPIFKRQRNQISNNDHTKAHFTPIIELKPILSGSTSNNERHEKNSVIQSFLGRGSPRSRLASDGFRLVHPRQGM